MFSPISIIYSEEFLEHNMGQGHPESPQRLTAVVQALQTASWQKHLLWQIPTAIVQRDPLPWIKKIHNPDYVELVKKLAQQGGGAIDYDTYVCPHSYEVALLAVNAWLDGVEQLLIKQHNAFVLARPPGHHATRKTGMGFCLFSNAAICAYYALSFEGIDKVGILDWDVHHGNGTQAVVENNSQIAYCSLHQFPCYPGTGRADDHGSSGQILNIPLSPGADFPIYQKAFEQKVLPFFSEFSPDLLIVSAGYDANAADTLASMNLKPENYGAFSHYAQQISDRLLFGLEGGYDLDALGKSVCATLAPFFS